jgi:hypothetical protein
MSALGQKQTYAVQNDMSALPPKADMERSITGRPRSYQIRTVRPRQCPRHDRVDSLSGHCIELTLKRIRPLLGSSLSVRPLEDGMDIPKQSRADRYESFYREFDSPLMQKIRRETFGEDIGLHSWGSAQEMRADVARLNVSSSSRIVDLGCGPCGPLTFILATVGCGGTGGRPERVTSVRRPFL